MSNCETALTPQVLHYIAQHFHAQLTEITMTTAKEAERYHNPYKYFINFLVLTSNWSKVYIIFSK